MGSISVKGLGKAYKHYPHRWSRLAEWCLPGRRPRHTLHWVLKEISFEVQSGEALGIIGINGAGKSTLLKMLAGTSKPTEGTLNIKGKVAALLELGMGFHPDFTGRQNCFMAGQLLGFTESEIAAMLPEVEAFAEIGSFIDEPVRVYSSGMQMRLAFSLATARRPDILMVDEALSVGDAYFQHKSFDRIREFRRQGTTLLLVSHDKQAIQSICDRAVLLNRGRLAMQGDPESVMDYYNALLADHQNQTIQLNARADGVQQTVSGTGEAGVTDIRLLDEAGSALDVVAVGQPVRLQVKVHVKAFIPRLVLGYAIKDRLGQVVFGTNTHFRNCPVEQAQPGTRLQFEFIFSANFGPGSYSVVTALHGSDSHIDKNYEWRDRALIFNVVNIDKETFTGVMWMHPEITVRALDD